MPGRKWRVRVGDLASRDLADILRWTVETFGEMQALSYKETLTAALRELTSGPDIPGSRARDDIMAGVRVLHVARRGRRGRHFIIYRTTGNRTIEIARILHDRMDLRRHLPETEDKGG